jgi:hypothetical protein
MKNFTYFIKIVNILLFFKLSPLTRASRDAGLSLKAVEVPDNKQIYVIAGNFSLNGEMLNFAEYDVASDKYVPC